MDPEFSFIIPTHNEEPWILQSTIEQISALSGDIERAEIIIIDDASTVPVRSEDLPAVPWRLKRCNARSGTARARNVGAAMAKGRTLIFTDAHVVFSPNWLDMLRQTDVANDGGIVGCETAILGKECDYRDLLIGNYTNVQTRHHGWKIAIAPQLRVEPVVLGYGQEWWNVPYVGCSALAIARKLFFELGQFSAGLVGSGCCEDLDLAARCWLSGRPVKSTRKAICYHYSANAREALEYSDPVSQDDIPRYPGSTANLLRILYSYFPMATFLDVCREKGLSSKQISWLVNGGQLGDHRPPDMLSPDALLDLMMAG